MFARPLCPANLKRANNFNGEKEPRAHEALFVKTSGLIASACPTSTEVISARVRARGMRDVQGLGRRGSGVVACKFSE